MDLLCSLHQTLAQYGKGKDNTDTEHAMKAYVEMKLWLHLFLKSALGTASRHSRLTPVKETPSSIKLEAGLSPGPVWTLWRRDKLCAADGNRTAIP